jgi:predicted O-methyltransferase YrrM
MMDRGDDHLEWKFNNTPLVADRASELPNEFIKTGAWSGHRRFAYDLVSYVKPNNIVELGTHYGASFFSFCQAIRDNQLPGSCYAVDTWQGDPHAGYYGEEVYQAVKTVNDREFPDIGILLRMNFDSALSEFEDGSIELLHIDGYHTYKAVDHDYTSWYPKLSENSIVLFHDIMVRYGDFGVYRLWEELRQQFPHFEFSHSFGLGVLFPKGLTKPLQAVITQKDAIVHHYQSNHTE